MSFATALSGLNNSALAIDVVSNNLANANTIGFKAARAQFSDVFAAAVSGGVGAVSPGLGVSTASIQQTFLQGTVRRTESPLDMAVAGRGFFRVTDADGVSYSRSGEFKTVGELDLQAAATGTTYTEAEIAAQDLAVLNSAGQRLTGYLASFTSDPAGSITPTGRPTEIVIPSSMPGAATSEMNLGLNLDAAETALDPAAFDPADQASFSFMTATNAYDAAGEVYPLATYFVKTQTANEWMCYTTLGTGECVGSVDLDTLATPIAGGDFTIGVNGETPVAVTLAGTFASPSALSSALQGAIDGAIGSGKAKVSLDATNHLVVTATEPGVTSSSVVIGGTAAFFGTPVQTDGGLSGPHTVTFDTQGKLASGGSIAITYTNAPIAGLTLDLSGSTQYGAISDVNSLDSNGYADGALAELNVSSDGVINATYTNGKTRKVAQVALAIFTNPGGLMSLGDNLWGETAASGAAQVDVAGSSGAKSLGLGPIVGSAVEDANVDVSAELVNLIVQQRYYQANAQSVKTQDQLLQTLSGIR